MDNKGLLVGGLAVLVVVVIGLVMWANRANAPATVGELQVTEPEQDITAQEYSATPAVGSPSVGTIKEFILTGTNFKFSMNEIRVKQGDTVRVTLTNDSTMPHDWRVDEFQAATKIVPPGQQDTVEFVANRAGQFEYYCSVGQHRQQGMKGTLIVE